MHIPPDLMLPSMAHQSIKVFCFLAFVSKSQSRSLGLRFGHMGPEVTYGLPHSGPKAPSPKFSGIGVGPCMKTPWSSMSELNYCDIGLVLSPQTIILTEPSVTQSCRDVPYSGKDSLQS